MVSLYFAYEHFLFLPSTLFTNVVLLLTSFFKLLSLNVMIRIVKVHIAEFNLFDE